MSDSDDARAEAERPRIHRPIGRPRAAGAVRPSSETPPQTVVLLHNAGAIRTADIDAAVSAYLADPSSGSVPLGASGYSLDLAAVKAYRPVQAVMKDAALGERYRRLTVRTAILLAVPTQP